MEALTRVIDITSDGYGAYGDENEDDDAIIQAAIAAAGGTLTAPQTVYFPQGRWLIQNTMVFNGINVWASPGAVFIPKTVDLTMVQMDPVSWWNGGSFRTYGINYVGTVFYIAGKDTNQQVFSGEITRSPGIFNVDVMGASKAGSKGIHLFSDKASRQITFMSFSNIRLIGFDKSIHIYADNSGGSVGYCNGNQFSNITLNRFGAAALHIEGSGGAACGGNQFTNVNMQSSTSSTIQTLAGFVSTACSGNFINNLICYDWFSSCPTAYAIDLDYQSANNIITGYGFQGYERNMGKDNYITGVTARLWGGADLTSDRKVKLSPGTVTAGSRWISDAINIGGAAVGDFVLFGAPHALTGVHHWGMVTAANTIKLRLENRTASDKAFTENGKWLVRILPGRKHTVKTTWALTTIADGGYETSRGSGFTVTGAELGDFVLVSLEPVAADLSGLLVSAAVTASNTVVVTLHNFTGSTITIDETITVRLKLIKKRGDYYGAWTPGVMADGVNANKSNVYTGAYAGTIVMASPETDIYDCCMSASGTTNAVYASLTNETGGSVTVGASNWNYRVIEEGEPLG